jgi:hypothetical protein
MNRLIAPAGLSPALTSASRAHLISRPDPASGPRVRCYEFEKFFAPRTVLALSESLIRFIDTRQRIPV